MTLFLLTLLLTNITITFVSVYLHRSLAHRSVTFHPIVSHIMRFYLWLTTGIVSTTWVAIHRKHHRYTDTEQDPHSPKILGFWNILFGGVQVYLREGRDPITMQAYGRGCPRDWIEKNFYERLNYLGLLICGSLYIGVFGWWGALAFIVHFLWIPFWAAGVVNGVGHTIGYRTYNTDDRSRNFFPFGLIMAGEELHNNHHNAPASAKLSDRWFEFDSGWMLIRTLELLGLADVHRRTHSI